MSSKRIEIFERNEDSRAHFVESIVAACKSAGTIGRATFVKKDGAIRNMRFIAAQNKGYEPTATGNRATGVARAKVNNPHHMRLIDLDLYKRAKKAGKDKQAAMRESFRIVNAATCLELQAHGVLFRMT